jgi:hypothetical protein
MHVIKTKIREKSAHQHAGVLGLQEEVEKALEEVKAAKSVKVIKSHHASKTAYLNYPNPLFGSYLI